MPPNSRSLIYITSAATTANHVALQISEGFLDFLDTTPHNSKNRARRMRGRKTKFHRIFVGHRRALHCGGYHQRRSTCDW
jgi:hypothetical protein